MLLGKSGRPCQNAIPAIIPRRRTARLSLPDHSKAGRLAHPAAAAAAAAAAPSATSSVFGWLDIHGYSVDPGQSGTTQATT